ncbi:ATP-binding component of ferric enterobactin transport FepC [Frigidibacter mobilis]|uniref:ATP-binding component of ferric enterobactin transport FepC n=1 Tax=Frigidibacter mobilis TaxID=1335048 RepID=A0A159Z1Y5_9RHOB|nr:ATP-binding component of ferric enterobactin transport FepC [Frigidibacter mobilis]
MADLSGGQRQRVWIALALAQQTEHLLLDEPTTWLDLPHQIEVLALLRRLNREEGRSIVTVLHDLSLAARFADHLVLMAAGRVLAEGPPAAVLTPDALHAAFGLRALVIADPVTGTPLVVPA